MGFEPDIATHLESKFREIERDYNSRLVEIQVNYERLVKLQERMILDISEAASRARTSMSELLVF